ncbi:hypothetical protein [uncultured Shewanella sp.]|uniref:hypothetical protein n=1 Tax=uncultured Shewanella sp. TaxID=173975 RepID=UPI002602CAEC|nr:hypothetical protein [uncultured Shewanella sp.]
MRLFLTLFLAATFSVNAGVLDELKETPATKYDLGKMQLEIFSAFTTQKAKGDSIKNTKFDFYNTSVIEQNNRLGLKVSFSGKSKYLTQEQCNSLHKVTTNFFPTEKLAKNMWPRLDEEKYTQLSSELMLVTELVDENNHSLTIKCGDI